MGAFRQGCAQHAGAVIDTRMLMNPHANVGSGWSGLVSIPPTQAIEHMSMGTAHTSLKNNYECTLGDDRKHRERRNKKEGGGSQKKKLTGRMFDQFEVLKEGDRSLKKLIGRMDGKLDKLGENVKGEDHARRLRLLTTGELYDSMLDHIKVLESGDSRNARAFVSLRRETCWLNKRGGELEEKGLKRNDLRLEDPSRRFRARGVEKSKVNLGARSRSKRKLNMETQQHMEILQSIGHDEKDTMLDKYIKQRERQVGGGRG